MSRCFQAVCCKFIECRKDVTLRTDSIYHFYLQRYYGKSLPFGNETFLPQNMGLLTVEQAMADYAVLIEHLKTTLNAANCKVIAFGGRLVYITFSKPFPTLRCILPHLQQMTFENIMTKGEIAQNKQFFLLPQCFQLFFQ